MGQLPAQAAQVIVVLAQLRQQVEGSKPRVMDLQPGRAERVTKPSDPLVRWVVQVGSFSSEENAVRLSGEIGRQGYPVFVSKVTAGDKTMHRVRVGPVADKDEAQALAQRLKTSGHAGRVMANGD